MTFAWVIEKHGCDRTCPIYWTGHFSPELEWSAPGEHVRACRFARFGDASAVAEYLSLHSPNKMPNDTHGVYEHGWDEVPCVHASKEKCDPSRQWQRFMLVMDNGFQWLDCSAGDADAFRGPIRQKPQGIFSQPSHFAPEFDDPQRK